MSDDYRNYNQCSKAVKEHYRKMRQFQTVDHVKCMHELHDNHNVTLLVWEALEYLSTCIDSSDPDMDLPNVHHLFQTAEGLRRDGYAEWFQLVGLLHDLGKVLFKFGSNDDGTSITEQWSVTGDTFLVGCRLPDSCILPEYNELNPDMNDDRYNTELGIYNEGCGLDNCLCAYGHDEYMYQVLCNSEHNIPRNGLRIIRYHSLYPWHSAKAYKKIMNNDDKKLLIMMRIFNKYDLYTKENTELNLNELRDYYNQLIYKFIPSGKLNF